MEIKIDLNKEELEMILQMERLRERGKKGMRPIKLFNLYQTGFPRF